MTYQPHCLMAWREMAAGMTEMAESRTVEQVMAELNGALQTLTEIEAIPQPHGELTDYRRRCAEWIAHRALTEAQAIQDMRAVIKKASV